MDRTYVCNWELRRNTSRLTASSTDLGFPVVFYWQFQGGSLLHCIFVNASMISYDAFVLSLYDSYVFFSRSLGMTVLSDYGICFFS